MNQPRHLGTFVVVLLCVAAVPGLAYAQDWARETQGPGFHLGRWVLHPGVSAEAGYDNNVFYEDSGQDGSALLRVSADLDFATASSDSSLEREQAAGASVKDEKIAFRGGVGAQFFHYFISQVQDNASADADLELTIRPKGRFALRLYDEFDRSIRPFAETPSGTATAPSYGRNDNTAGIEQRFRSKSGIFIGRLGYEFQNIFYDDFVYEWATNLIHRAKGGFEWRFFPKTSFIYEVDFSVQNYNKPHGPTVAPTFVSDNMRVNTRAGLHGVLTPKTSLTLLVGYAGGFYDAGSDFNNVIASAEARWIPRSTIGVRTGFLRSVSPSSFGNFVTSNRLYFDTRFVIAKVFSIGTQSSVSFDKTGVVVAGDGVTIAGTQRQRKDIRIKVGTDMEYRIRDWIALIASVIYTGDLTDFSYTAVMGGATVDPSGEFHKVEAWGGVRVSY